MKTIELDLEKDDKLKSLSSLIKDKNIKLGEEEFQLVIQFYYEINKTLYASLLLFLVEYFIQERNKLAHDKNFDLHFYNTLTKNYYEFYFKNQDVTKLENKIEKDFKIDIELEKKNPLDDVFGIWKNEGISLENIRDKAWQRNN